MRIACSRLVLPDEVRPDVLVELDDAGVVTAVGPAGDGATVDLAVDVAAPAFANTHSHAFHRLLRGRTNGGGGDFWRWRDVMYGVAGTLDPDGLRAAATAVYAEMVAAGYSAVGEFHYLHHRPDGTPYAGHDMELALADAATAAGIRLTLLDTVYLRGGFGRELEGAQRRFSDGSLERWHERWHALDDALRASHPEVTLGAAIHSVRAVVPDHLAYMVAGLPHEVPLHLHLSEQTRENEECLAETGLTPTALLDRAGVLDARTTVVHATHLTDADVATLGAARVSVSMCPTTEADLGDGLGHAEALRDAGARLTVGSDQNVVIDPFDELRRLEGGARLASHRRGVLSPADLWSAGTVDGHAAIAPVGTRPQAPAVGSPLDLVVLDPGSARTVGSDAHELVLTAAAEDVLGTVVRGVHRASSDLRRLAADAYPRREHLHGQ
ncbi:formimidoylglutamate deiminase [Demequina sp. SYSU T00192]|uniref:Formimidoylglutamate deiminase n=1 Tax=Demequina litoralis TaxID=3051660 RepID=A0ABT8G6Q6_9MICO|nr:formimidoylglutamate deiminase [Demequina sp. SYSU T00192]MDN4474803.1 formimidoylglutamate deiminase [Demequina sp. SYSU T00192]